MIQKHAIPILEFDDNPQAVLMPTHEGLDLKLPKKCIYAFLEEENAFLIPVRALRDEGTSYHYVAPSRYMEMQIEAVSAIEQVLEQRGIPYEEVMTWTTDGFYRETAEKVAYRKEEGCAVMEMECSALAAVAQLRGVVWGELLFTADSLADLENYDSRDWGSEAFDKALELCLAIVHHM